MLLLMLTLTYRFFQWVNRNFFKNKLTKILTYEIWKNRFYLLKPDGNNLAQKSSTNAFMTLLVFPVPASSLTIRWQLHPIMEVKNTPRSMDDFLTSQVTVGFQRTIKKQTGFRLILVKSFKCVLLLPRGAITVKNMKNGRQLSSFFTLPMIKIGKLTRMEMAWTW